MYQFQSLQEWREAVLEEKKERRKEWAQMPYEVKMRIVQEMVQFADKVYPIREQLREHLSTSLSTGQTGRGGFPERSAGWSVV